MSMKEWLKYIKFQKTEHTCKNWHKFINKLLCEFDWILIKVVGKLHKV